MKSKELGEQDAVFRGDVFSVPLDRVNLRCTACGASAVVALPQPNTIYRMCDCPDDYQELTDYRATLPDGKVVGPAWGELPKGWSKSQQMSKFDTP